MTRRYPNPRRYQLPSVLTFLYLLSLFLQLRSDQPPILRMSSFFVEAAPSPQFVIVFWKTSQPFIGKITRSAMTRTRTAWSLKHPSTVITSLQGIRSYCQGMVNEEDSIEGSSISNNNTVVSRSHNRSSTIDLSYSSSEVTATDLGSINQYNDPLCR